ncbi:MAG: methylated-DNA--[protein]-cysteine S-methyltransferase [Planctomycetota bacterium]|jgi:methylated-DNA-[protein]-cysteine S-methyltransferase
MSKFQQIPAAVRYTVFRTRWGYFGLAGTDRGLLRTCLPLPSRHLAESHLLTNLPDARREKKLFKKLQEQVTAYYEGTYVVFNTDIGVLLDDKSLFARKVLTCLRSISFGRTTTYGRLAEKAGRPKAARAVGSVLAGNPLPLIIPCHRVLRSPCLRTGGHVPAQAGIGGFSAPGGVSVKKRMLQLERNALASEA